jgi:hypothetical protein
MKGKHMNEKHMSDKTMEMHKDSYTRLLIMSLLSLIAMYFLMYSMVFTFDHFYNNVNKFYMAAIMTAPMVVFELILIWLFQSRLTKGKK